MILGFAILFLDIKWEGVVNLDYLLQKTSITPRLKLQK